jgi:hypothetical protein
MAPPGCVAQPNIEGLPDDPVDVARAGARIVEQLRRPATIALSTPAVLGLTGDAHPTDGAGYRAEDRREDRDWARTAKQDGAEHLPLGVARHQDGGAVAFKGPEPSREGCGLEGGDLRSVLVSGPLDCRPPHQGADHTSAQAADVRAVRPHRHGQGHW